MRKSTTVITCLVAACLLMAAPAFAADESDTAQATVGGVIPELCQIALSDSTSASILTLGADGAGETAYDAGEVVSAADATTLTLDANMQWKLSMAVGTWTCPGEYDKAETDVLFQITNVPTGTIQNSFDSYATAASITEILSHPSGVSDDSVEIQTKVLLDWTADIPGTYSITVTYTMETDTTI